MHCAHIQLMVNHNEVSFQPKKKYDEINYFKKKPMKYKVGCPCLTVRTLFVLALDPFLPMSSPSASVLEVDRADEQGPVDIYK